VSENEPLGSDDGPFGENPFGELAKLFGSFGLGGLGASDPWQSARQIANSVVNEGGAQPNLDPLVRMAVDDLARVADLHVRQVAGIRLGSDTTVRAVSRSAWTETSLDAYRPFFERFGEAMGTSGPQEEAFQGDPMAAMMGQMFSSLGPMMVASSAGSMIGHLGLRALGQYDLPVPRQGSEVLVVPTTIDAAAKDWGFSQDELRLVVLIRELAAHSVLSTPHVAKRLDSLFIDFASAFRPNAELLSEQFGDITDLSQIQQISEKMNDPEAILAMMRSPAHDLLVPQLDALVSAVLGYVDHAVGVACANLVPSNAKLREALNQRMLDVSPADRFMERLLGIDVDAATLERGTAFIDGIVSRAGDAGLQRLWANELDMPTAAEVDAPGLWLARIGLDPDLPAGTNLTIPDDLSGLEDL